MLGNPILFDLEAYPSLGHSLARTGPKGTGNGHSLSVLVSRERFAKWGARVRRRVVFVFDLAPAPCDTPQNPQFGTWREYVVAGDVHEHSARLFRTNARWLVRAFVRLLRTVRGHCAPLQFLIGGAGMASSSPRRPKR